MICYQAENVKLKVYGERLGHPEGERRISEFREDKKWSEDSQLLLCVPQSSANQCLKMSLKTD